VLEYHAEAEEATRKKENRQEKKLRRESIETHSQVLVVDFFLTTSVESFEAKCQRDRLLSIQKKKRRIQRKRKHQSVKSMSQIDSDG
jgi:hypothetical protein